MVECWIVIAGDSENMDGGFHLTVDVGGSGLYCGEDVAPQILYTGCHGKGDQRPGWLGARWIHLAAGGVSLQIDHTSWYCRSACDDEISIQLVETIATGGSC